MALDRKQLSEATPVPTDRQTMRLDAARMISRRQQALLAAAGESGPCEPRWYVLTLVMGTDISVDNALTNAGIEHWMAVLTFKGKRRSGRKWQSFCSTVKAAFPGYMFVRVAWSEITWHGLKGIAGVGDVVGGAICPSPLQDKEMHRFRLRAEKDPQFIRKLVNALSEGDAVRIDTGPFSGCEGVVRTLFEKTARAGVDVDIFGRVATVDLELAQITKVD